MDIVCILMATHNGEKFLENQINSILRQDYQNWRLLISDDGSTDQTEEIIDRFCLLDDRIVKVNYRYKEHGQLRNFKWLMNSIDADNYDYFMFSDQDDVWNKSKVSKTLIKMKKSESGPTLIYTNYIENNNDGAFFKRYEFDYARKYGYACLLVQNWIMGCTMMINKELLTISLNIPKEAENHDNWIMLVALTYGNIVFLDEITMFHRIHDNNVTNNFSKDNICFKIDRFVNNVINSKKVNYRLVVLYNKVLSVHFDAKTKYVKKFLDILNTRNKLKRILKLKKLKAKGLNVHKTFELWATI